MHRRISQYDGISSVVGLVENALLVAMAGQRYVSRCLGQPGASAAIKKGLIPHYHPKDEGLVQASKAAQESAETSKTLQSSTVHQSKKQKSKAAKHSSSSSSSSSAAEAKEQHQDHHHHPTAHHVQHTTPSATSSVVDFVTEADLTVQEMAEQLLFSEMCAPKCFSRRSGSLPLRTTSETHHVPPISFVGEESLHDSNHDRDLRSFKWFEDVVATQESAQYVALLEQFRSECGATPSAAMTNAMLASKQAFLSTVPPNDVDRVLLAKKQLVVNSLPKQISPTVQIYVDPIDGTNAMVAGRKRVPMMLIGICLSGVPVAGVVNRLFATTQSTFSSVGGEEDDQGGPPPETKSPSVCPPTISLCIEGGPCWIDGRKIRAPQSYKRSNAAAASGPATHTSLNNPAFGPLFNRSSRMQVLCGSNGRARHDSLFSKLEPCEWYSMRGAGCKLMDIANSAAILGNLEAKEAEAARHLHKEDARAAHERKQQKQQKQLDDAANNNKNSNANPTKPSSSGPIPPSAVAVNADTKAAAMTFDSFVASGEVKKWDTCAPHAFLRWLNADLARVYESKSTKQVMFYPIDYAERSGQLDEFDGFDVSLDPRIVCTVNAASMQEVATRLSADIVQQPPSSKL